MRKRVEMSPILRHVSCLPTRMKRSSSGTVGLERPFARSRSVSGGAIVASPTKFWIIKRDQSVSMICGRSWATTQIKQGSVRASERTRTARKGATFGGRPCLHLMDAMQPLGGLEQQPREPCREDEAASPVVSTAIQPREPRPAGLRPSARDDRIEVWVHLRDEAVGDAELLTELHPRRVARDRSVAPARAAAVAHRPAVQPARLVLVGELLRGEEEGHGDARQHG
jgi:hypothetical protein